MPKKIKDFKVEEILEICQSHRRSALSCYNNCPFYINPQHCKVESIWSMKAHAEDEVDVDEC